MYGSAILNRRGSVGYWGFQPELCALIEPFYPKPDNGLRRSGSSGCCEFISCSTGSICRSRQSKRRSTIRKRWCVKNALTEELWPEVGDGVTG